jgi:PAS domain S-box-containing protein
MPDSGNASANGALQAIVDFLPSGVSLFDRDFNMVLCNRIFRELLEFPEHLFTDRLPSLEDLALFNAHRGEYGPGEPANLAAQVVERAKERRPHVFERERPNGRILEIRGNPLPDGGFVSIYTDITDRKRAEQEARRSAHYLDAVVNALPQGISVVNEALDVVLWNRAFVNLLNLPEDFMTPGITFADVIRFNARRGEYGDVDPEEKVRQMVDLARRFERHKLERELRGGGVLEIEGRVVREEGHPVGFVTTYTDITDRVRNAETIRRVRDLMSDAIDFSPTYIWETGSDGRYSFVQGVEKILGFKDDEMLGTERGKQFCTEHCDQDCLGPGVRCDRMEPVRARETLDRCTLVTRRADGSVVWLSSSAQPIFEEGGRFVGYRGVDVDITELSLAKRELEQMALHDPMTGLANRRKFSARFDLERTRQSETRKSFALLLVDVDHFP